MSKFSKIASKGQKEIETAALALLEEDQKDNLQQKQLDLKNRIKTAKRTLIAAEDPKAIKDSGWLDSLIKAEKELALCEVEEAILTKINREWFE